MKRHVRAFVRRHYAQAVSVRWIYATTRAGARRGLFWQLVARYYGHKLAKRFGIYVSHNATIGQGLMLPHPVGIVIGESCSIGENATIYQHVTIGRRSRNDPRYPVIGGNVVLYPGAVVIGPVRIGKFARIGANQVVSFDLPDGSVVAPPTALAIDRRNLAEAPHGQEKTA
ncbi:serine acetyltransferase [Sphingobium sp. Sx8-8]|uniref:serine O-acetyltransferase n=1 Tax=Sphingobium sp. Sx8-8 TaxID=2933617 RepID=UPI001F55F339|nr:serine acetyltransferase [Sphingobium sp. Sx8-8]